MSVLEKVKANKIVVIAAAFILVMTTITGTLKATGELDRLIMTEYEHDKDFVPLSAAVAGIQSWNKCVRLEARIAELEDRKWKRQQAGATPDAIRDIDNDITALRRSYNSLSCDSVLS